MPAPLEFRNGQRFGCVEVVRRADENDLLDARKNASGLSWWVCRCNCNAVVLLPGRMLKARPPKACSLRCPLRESRGNPAKGAAIAKAAIEKERVIRDENGNTLYIATKAAAYLGVDVKMLRLWEKPSDALGGLSLQPYPHAGAFAITHNYYRKKDLDRVKELWASVPGAPSYEGLVPLDTVAADLQMGHVTLWRLMRQRGEKVVKKPGQMADGRHYKRRYVRKSFVDTIKAERAAPVPPGTLTYRDAAKELGVSHEGKAVIRFVRQDELHPRPGKTKKDKLLSRVEVEALKKKLQRLETAAATTPGNWKTVPQLVQHLRGLRIKNRGRAINGNTLRGLLLKWVRAKLLERLPSHRWVAAKQSEGGQRPRRKRIRVSLFDADKVADLFRQRNAGGPLHQLIRPGGAVLEAAVGTVIENLTVLGAIHSKEVSAEKIITSAFTTAETAHFNGRAEFKGGAMVQEPGAAQAATGAVTATDANGKRLGVPECHEDYQTPSKAIETAAAHGYDISLVWLSKHKKKLRTRPRQIPGNHNYEVEMGSVMALVIKKVKRREADSATGADDSDEPEQPERAAIEKRKLAEQSRKPRDLS